MYSRSMAGFMLAAITLSATACAERDATAETETANAASNGAATTAASETEIAAAKTKAVLVYADWCSSCKALDPKLKAVKAANPFDDVQFVVLDYTARDETAFYAAAAKAGVEPAVRDALSKEIKTGVLLLVDADDNKVVGKVTKTFSEAEIVSAINAAVAAS